ncbi:MAG: cadherin-like beta sandwich domain-containing protein [Methanoregula sp.]|jgi:predicted secreted protein|nr:cadherin-like beta sandwich domain-containing protein [Methanoregula sp.]
MTSSGFSPFGTTLVWADDPILELTKIDPPFGTADDVDITNHDSADYTEEFVPGIIRVGTVDLEGNLLPSDTDGQIAMLGDLQSRTARAAAVILPAGKGMMSFTASAKSFKPTLPYDGKAGVAISLKCTGKVTLTTTAAGGLTTPFFALRDNGSNAVTPSPAAAGAVYNYHATLDAADTHIAIQPTAAAGTIYVNGTAVVSGAWSGNIAVAAGTTKLLIVESREANKASKIYRIYVARPSS